ncbi:hypothetical protein FOMPIDRAFT_92723 [Fomitopsis schrenkii]|uniref:Uncharacterized protein n=1 Tax=Fomitopsis schrenkii TaxID=2126942 RepID=S8FFL6_FOMSC|nr:hypothetical protein FOMPIDRAFT_92723 [Fomitopsis schrenkii]
MGEPGIYCNLVTPYTSGSGSTLGKWEENTYESLASTELSPKRARTAGSQADAARDITEQALQFINASLGQGEDGSEVLEYDFDVDEKAHRSVYTEFGFIAIGRGTMVIPAKARPRAGAASGVQASEEPVEKVAWPHAAQTGEDVLIRKIRSRLEATGIQKKKIQWSHIADLKVAMTKDRKDANLPRHAMGLCPDEQDV